MTRPGERRPRQAGSGPPGFTRSSALLLAASVLFAAGSAAVILTR